MKVSVVAAHPDDELIGVGGTILKHISNGDKIQILIICEGKSSRYMKFEDMDRSILDYYHGETTSAMKIMKIDNYQVCNYPNNRLDTMPLLDIIKTIQNYLDEFKPDVVYTHSYTELNIDHLIINKAVVTAVRALPDSYVRELLFFTTLSSTEQARAIGKYFEPNIFVDISPFIEKKLEALSCYQSELRMSPHPRNTELIRANDRVCGSKVGIEYAEEFMIGRIMR